MPQTDFNIFSETYNQDLGKGLSLSGESGDYFAEKRVAFLSEYLGGNIQKIVEFGCGIGNNIEFLYRFFPKAQIIGLDISDQSLRIAEERFASKENISFRNPQNPTEDLAADLVFVNGVFHHIPHKDHPEHLRALYTILNSHGRLCLFDNNPFNPGARWVMKRIPFDKDAVMVNPYQLKKDALHCGFTDIEIKFHFIFPKMLSFLRFAEKPLINLPLGAQYCLMASKPYPPPNL